jgi:hypothetical protein
MLLYEPLAFMTGYSAPAFQVAAAGRRLMRIIRLPAPQGLVKLLDHRC